MIKMKATVLAVCNETGKVNRIPRNETTMAGNVAVGSTCVCRMFFRIKECSKTHLK